MKVLQFYDFTDKNIYYGILKDDIINKIEGDIFGTFTESNDWDSSYSILYSKCWFREKLVKL